MSISSVDEINLEKFLYSYSLFADTPHKRTSLISGHFLRDRWNMYGFANKIFPLKRTPYSPDTDSELQCLTSHEPLLCGQSVL
jgi:hypothetical protein